MPSPELGARLVPPPPAQGSPWSRRWGWQQRRHWRNYSAAPGERARCGSAADILPPAAPSEPNPASAAFGWIAPPEDAPQEPGSRASGGPHPGRPAHTLCGDCGHHGHVAVTRSLQAPVPSPQLSRAGEGTLEGRSCPTRPWRADFRLSSSPPTWKLCSRWAPGLTLAGHQGLSPPLGDIQKLGCRAPAPRHSRPSLAARPAAL